MYQYLSRVPSVISKFTDISAMLILTVLSLTLKHLDMIETTVVATFILAFTLNVLIIKARTMLCSYYIQAALLVLIFFNVTKLLGVLYLYELVLDILLVTVLLVVLTLYWHYIDVASLFARPLLPVSVLVAGFMGVYIGVNSITRYLILTVLDALCSLTLLRSQYGNFSAFFRGFVFFTCIYSIPGLRLTWFSLLVFATLHIIRNTAQLGKVFRVLKGRVLELLCLDMLLKPFVVMYA